MVPEREEVIVAWRLAISTSLLQELVQKHLLFRHEARPRAQADLAEAGIVLVFQVCPERSLAAVFRFMTEGARGEIQGRDISLDVTLQEAAVRIAVKEAFGSPGPTRIEDPRDLLF